MSGLVLEIICRQVRILFCTPCPSKRCVEFYNDIREAIVTCSSYGNDADIGVAEKLSNQNNAMTCGTATSIPYMEQCRTGQDLYNGDM